jgi:hemerythrin
MSLVWTDDLTVGVMEIDTSNKDIFDKFNRFCQAVEEGNGGKGLIALVAFLDKYKQHFSCEENLHRKSACPGFEEHQDDHKNFVSEIEQLKQEMQKQKPTKELILGTRGRLVRWLIAHIKEKDKVLCSFLLSNAAESEKEFANMELGDIFVEVDLISPTTLERALLKQREDGRNLGAILQVMGVVNADDIKCAVATQEGKFRITKKLGEILVKTGIISHSTLERAIETQHVSNKPIGLILQDMGVVTQMELAEAQAIQKGMLKQQELR